MADDLPDGIDQQDLDEIAGQSPLTTEDSEQQTIVEIQEQNIL